MTAPSPIYDRYAGPILDQAMLDATFDAPYEQPWERAIYAAGHNLALAGYADWRLNAAGLVAAHAIRLASEESVLDGVAWQLGSPRDDDRIDAANAIRSERRDPVTILVWRWLSSHGDRAPVVCGQLARHVATHIEDYRGVLGPAWYAASGKFLLGALGRTDPAPGPMSADDRAALVPAVRGCRSARMWSKTGLAHAAGITRPTLDAWTAENQS